jgi:hypothetical protein
MQMLIEIEGKGVALCVPSELAESATRLIASTRVVENKYSSSRPWEPSDAKLILTFAQNAVLVPLTEHEIAANKAAEKHRNDWYKEYTENLANKKRIDVLEKELATIRSLTTCTQTPAEPEVIEDVVMPQEPDDIGFPDDIAF